MSKRIEAKLGVLGYEAFKPQKPGKVISVRPSNRFPDESYVTLKFLDGSTKEINASHVNDYEELIEEHRRKYEKFNLVAQELSKI